MGMLLSLALIFLVGFSAAAIFNAIRLPRIIGMIATGIVLGPYVLDLLDPTIPFSTRRFSGYHHSSGRWL